MKGYVKPEPFKEGVCFICGRPCDEGHYCHYECAQAFNTIQRERIKQAHDKALQQERETRGGKENGVS